jgi:hypothetical protein
MFWPAWTVPLDAVLVTDKSALGVVTVTATLAELLPAFGSVALVMIAVLSMLVPSGVEGSTFTRRSIVVVSLATTADLVQVIAPVPPTSGVVHGQAPLDNETNVVFAGTAADSVEVPASEGPLFVSTIR